MNLEELRKEARELLATFEVEARMSSAMSDTSISSVSELFLLEVLREVFDLPDLRNLNAERQNFPGLDLGDDRSGNAFQVTADRTLAKIVDCIETVVRENLYVRYPRVRVFITTGKQRSYLQTTIDQATAGKLKFDGKTDVIDCGDLAATLSTFELDRLNRVVRILRKHLRRIAVDVGGSEADEARERDMARRYELAVQSQGFSEVATVDPFLGLALEVIETRASRTSTSLRRRILLRAARSAALRQRLEDAERFLSTALTLPGPDSELPARARIAEGRGDLNAAMQLLRDEKDSDARSTLLSLIIRANGDDAALTWLADLKFEVRDLTANGLITLCGIYLRRADVSGLLSALNAAIETQLGECPYLFYLRGMARLVSVFPAPDQLTTLGAIPLDVSFARPILSEGELAARLDASAADLGVVVATARALGLQETMRVVQGYLTWGELLHPHKRDPALQKLRASLADPATALHFLQFGFEFDKSFDASAIDEWLTKRESVGGLNDDELRAALIIRLHSEKPESVARIIAKHRGRYESMLGEQIVLLIEVQALALAGDVTSARMRLQEGERLLDAPFVVRLRAEIAKAEGADPVTEHLQVYEAARTVDALRALVRALVQKGDAKALGAYAEKLYGETRDRRDLIVSARAYYDAGEYGDFVRLIEAFPFLQNDDPDLKRRYAWQLVQLGKLTEAKRVSDDLREISAARDLNLEIAIAVDSGRWELLAAPLGALLERAESSDGLSILRAAHLAYASGFGPTRELLEAAVRRAPDDPQVLIGAYTLAVESGLEDEMPQARDWFRQALERSGPEGPVQRFGLKEVLDRQVAWNAQSRKIDEAILRGELPLIVAAPALRTFVTEVVLGNLVRNASLSDPRQRSVVPLYTGRRAPTALGAPERVALDVTAVLVLGWLGLLPQVFQAFPHVILPAGLLYEIFEGRRRVRQYQRSRVVRAKRLQELIARKVKLVDVSSARTLDDLAEKVGPDLAALIRAASEHNGIVVRPAPVLRFIGESEEEVSLSEYADCLADTRALLRVLSDLGVIDQTTEDTSRRFFEVQDRGWASSALPEKNRPLYLDDLAISYLQAVGLLELVASEFNEVYIPSSAAEDAAALLEADRRADECVRTIDAIRDAIRKADDEGRITFGRRRGSGEGDEVRDLSTLHLLSNMMGANLVVFDDRALNQEFFATDASGQVRTATSLDVLEELKARNLISEAQWRACRHRLRVGGAGLVPATSAEVRLSAQRSARFESAEFRAIRESISLARMRAAPRFPSEVPWFIGVTMAMKGAIMELWGSESDLSRAATLSNSIMDARPRPIDWIALWSGGPPSGWVEAVDRTSTASMALPVEMTDQPSREAYQRWLRSRVLEPLRSSDPAAYASVLEQVKAFVRLAGDDADD